MTQQLDALEQAITTLQSARRDVKWISEDNPVWLMLWHAERHLSKQFKTEFREYFGEVSENDDAQ